MNAAIREAFEELGYHIAELTRRSRNMLLTGTVKEFKNGKAIVSVDGFDTHEIPVGYHAGAGKDWGPLKKGQQVTLLNPSGDIANAVILPGGFHDENKAPSESADEDIRAERGEGDKAVRLRTTDSGAHLENKAKKTAVSAGDEVAELVNSNGSGSAVRAKSGGVVHLEATSLANLKIVIGGQAYQIKPDALLPTSL